MIHVLFIQNHHSDLLFPISGAHITTNLLVTRNVRITLTSDLLTLPIAMHLPVNPMTRQQAGERHLKSQVHPHTKALPHLGTAIIVNLTRIQIQSRIMISTVVVHTTIPVSHQSMIANPILRTTLSQEPRTRPVCLREDSAKRRLNHTIPVHPCSDLLQSTNPILNLDTKAT